MGWSIIIMHSVRACERHDSEIRCCVLVLDDNFLFTNCLFYLPQLTTFATCIYLIAKVIMFDVSTLCFDDFIIHCGHSLNFLTSFL